MATCRLLLLRRPFFYIVLIVTLSALTGCGGDDAGDENALAPGSGPSAAPPGPVNIRPSSSLPPVIPGTPRIPASQNTPIVMRTLQQQTPSALSLGGCDEASAVTARILSSNTAMDLAAADPLAGPAEEVVLRGQISVVDTATATFTVLGQPVRITEHTRYAGTPEPVWTAGAGILVRGLIAAGDVLEADEVRTLSHPDITPCVSGPIAEIEAAGQRIRIGSLWVNDGSGQLASIANTAGAVVAEGQIALDQKALVASSIAPLRRIDVRLEGPVTALDADAGQFVVLNTVVRVSPATALTMAPSPEIALMLADLRVGDWIRVAAWAEGPTLQAAAIVALPAATGIEVARISAPMTGMTAQGNTLQVVGTRLVLDTDTRFQLGEQTVSADAFFTGADPAGRLRAEGGFTGEAFWVRHIGAPRRNSP